MKQHTSVIIDAIGVSNPPCVLQQSEAFGLIRKHYGDVLKPRSLAVMEQILSHPAIKQRYIALDSIKSITQIRDETPDERMERFTKWSVKLSEQAFKNALKHTDLTKNDIGAIVVNTCTGYICPGISTYLIGSLGLPSDTKVFDLVGAGCGGAVPNLQMGQSLFSIIDKPAVVCISVEICTATYQMGDDMSLLISNAIFGDGAAAVILRKGENGLSIQSSKTHILPEYREDVRYYYKKGQLYNKLSPALPKTTGDGVSILLKQFLNENSLSIDSIDNWAIHPGGDKILNAIQEKLKLSDKKMGPSRDIHREFGNMSSPSVLFVLKRLIDQGIAPGDNCLLTAFGAGMSIHAMLLDQRG
jgi:predicted naringenin-chalcone synthase